MPNKFRTCPHFDEDDADEPTPVLLGSPGQTRRDALPPAAAAAGTQSADAGNGDDVHYLRQCAPEGLSGLARVSGPTPKGGLSTHYVRALWASNAGLCLGFAASDRGLRTSSD